MVRNPIQISDNSPIVITPEEKDKIVEALIQIRRNDFTFGYKDVPGLLLEKYQFEEVMEELSQMGLIICSGYYDGGKKHKTANLDEFYRFGGFRAKDKLLFDKLKKLELELESLKKEANPAMIDKIGSITNIVSTVVSIIQSSLYAI